MVYERLADWPRLLNRQDICPDYLAVLFGHFFKPFAHWFIARIRLKEDDRKRTFSFHLPDNVSVLVRLSNGAVHRSRVVIKGHCGPASMDRKQAEDLLANRPPGHQTRRDAGRETDMQVNTMREQIPPATFFQLPFETQFAIHGRRRLTNLE